MTVDCEAQCKYLRHENGSGSGTVTFTGSGTLTCSGNAAGPSVSGYLSSNTKVAFANITANLGGFNPWNGNLIIEDGANVGVIQKGLEVGGTLLIGAGELVVLGEDVLAKRHAETVHFQEFDGGFQLLGRNLARRRHNADHVTGV